jgi:hypothetical protein
MITSYEIDAWFMAKPFYAWTAKAFSEKEVDEMVSNILEVFPSARYTVFRVTKERINFRVTKERALSLMTVRIIRACGAETDVTFPVSVSISAVTSLLHHEGIIAIEIIRVSR